jgi:hypothetical protein
MCRGHRQQSTERGGAAEEMTMTVMVTATETARVPCYGGGGGNVGGGGGRTQVLEEAATMVWGIFQSGVSCHF